MGIDGTLTLCVPRRQLEVHWWLPAGGDPASLAERFASLQAPLPAAARHQRLPGSSPSAAAERHDSVGEHLLRCLEGAVLLDRSPLWSGQIRPGADRRRGSAPRSGSRLPLSHRPNVQRPLRVLLEACLAVPLEATIPATPWPSPAVTPGFHARLTLQRWNPGPVWIAIWRCHGHCGWQRRCGPMPLSDFLAHQRRRQHPTARQSGAALRRPPLHDS